MAMSKRSKRRLMARSRSSQWTRAGNGPTVDYLVVVDFEATCERGDKTYAHEIVEFPAVLLRTADATVAGEFPPTCGPRRTPRRPPSTGADGHRAATDSAETLDVVLARFTAGSPTRASSSD